MLNNVGFNLLRHRKIGLIVIKVRMKMMDPFSEAQYFFFSIAILDETQRYESPLNKIMLIRRKQKELLSVCCDRGYERNAAGSKWG